MSYIGTQPVPQSLESRQEFTATASQTTFATNGYTVGYVDVYLNGVKLSTSDFTATNGSDVVLGSGAAAGDVLAVVMKNDHSELIALPITDSAGNNVLSESGGVVTLTADEANVGSNALVVDANGNVGVGTSSPDTDLHVYKSDTTTGAILTLEGGAAIVANGRVGEVRFVGGRATGGTDLGSIKLINSNVNYWDGNPDREDTSLVFNTAENRISGERMRIDSSGNVKINNLSASSDVQTDASKNLITTSDARLKNEIGLIDESGIEVIKQIIPKYFSWKNDENNNQQLGFFAQDIYPVLPEAAPRVLKYTEVGKNENDEPILEQVFDQDGNPDYEWGFTDRPIIAMCVKAIQEQQTLIESQQSQIDVLTARIEALEATP